MGPVTAGRAAPANRMAAADVVGETVSTTRQPAEAGRGTVGDTARRAEIVRDGIHRMEVPSDEQVSRVLARTAEAPAMPMADPLLDRKSTRLNSSHSSI